MKTMYVPTSNQARLEAGVEVLKERGAREAGGLILTGRPGDGKTSCLKHWGAQVDAVMVTCTSLITPGRLVDELARKLGLPMTRDIDQAIGERLLQHGKTVILDEAQFALYERAACLERLRGITDFAGTPWILVLMEADVWRLTQCEQISSRIADWVEFQPATLADVTAVVGKTCEVQLDAAVVQRIHADTGGRMRLVVNAISRVEMVAKALGKTELCARDLAKTTLVHDYRNGRQGLGGLRGGLAPRGGVQ